MSNLIGIGHHTKKPTPHCEICQQIHSPLTLCSHGILVQIINNGREQWTQLNFAYREAIKVAKEFQDIIVQFEPRMTVLNAHAGALCTVLQHALDCEHFTPGGSTEKWARDSIADYEKFKGTTKSDS